MAEWLLHKGAIRSCEECIYGDCSFLHTLLHTLTLSRTLSHRILVAFSVRPSRCWAICAHLLPICRCNDTIILSSAGVQAPCRRDGSR